MKKETRMQLSFTEEENEVMREVSDYLLTKLELAIDSTKKNNPPGPIMYNTLQAIENTRNNFNAISKNPNILFLIPFKSHVIGTISYISVLESTKFKTNKKIKLSLIKKLTIIQALNNISMDKFRNATKAKEKEKAQKNVSAKKEIKSKPTTAKATKLMPSKKTKTSKPAKKKSPTKPTPRKGSK